MTDQERLSAWLSGHLSAEEAAAIEARLAVEPELQRQLDLLTSLVSDLEGLPELGAPPPLRAPSTPRQASRGLHPGWLAVAAAAGALLTAALPSAPPPIADLEPAHITVGDHLVQTHGSISLSPAQEDSTMDWTHAASAAVGGLLTLTVTAGTADVTTPDGNRTTLQAGDSMPVAPSTPAAPAATTRQAHPTPSRDALTETGPLTASAPSHDALEQLHFENELLRGQLSLLQGEPIPWPDGLDEAITPNNFERHLLDALPETSVYALDGIDCSEYPCIGFLVANDPGEDHGRADLDALNAALRDIDGAARVSMSHGVSETDRGTHSVVAVAIAGDTDTPNLSQRLDFRSESGMRDRLENLGADDAPAPE